MDFWEIPTDEAQLTPEEGDSHASVIGRQSEQHLQEAACHPELVATMESLASRLSGPEFVGIPVVLYDGRHASDGAGGAQDDEQVKV